jgi:hypothetical protein
LRPSEVLYKPVPVYNTPWQLLFVSQQRPLLLRFNSEQDIMDYLYSTCRSEDSVNEIIRQANLKTGTVTYFTIFSVSVLGCSPFLVPTFPY